VELRIQLSPIMDDLFSLPARYRVVRGGRAGSKSYGFADMALVRMCSEKTDVVVCREYDSTIKESVHKLICSRIDDHKLRDAFYITDNKIVYSKNNSILTYKHLHNNFTEVKGLEGNDICWLFEGHDLQENSWSVLNPTIRRTPRMTNDPEIWIEFNPQYEDDFVYRFFVNNPPEDCVSMIINYTDNPWCPEEMKRLAEQCRRENEDEYKHIWLGEPRNVGGLVYPMFDMKEHIRDVSMSRIEHVANFFMGQDPHTAYYPACVWLGRMPNGDGTFDYYWYNEFPTKAMFGGKLYHEMRHERKCALTLTQRAKIFKLLDNTLDKTYHGIKIDSRAIDTRFAKGSGSGSTTNNTRGIIIEMADTANGGLLFETPPEYMIDGQGVRIRELLRYDLLSPKSVFNQPKMYVMPHCENIIDTFRFHRYDKSGKEKEDDKRKDFSDAMRITMAQEQQYQHIDRTVGVDNFFVGEDRLAEMVNSHLGKNSYSTTDKNYDNITPGRYAEPWYN